MIPSPRFDPGSGAALPPPVHPGDRVGVAALSGPVDPQRLECGLEALRGLGFEPVPAANLRSRAGLFAGTDEERLEGFHALVADPGVRAIVFARGGHGLLRLLPHFDWELLASRPLAFVGYSDLTPFLLQVVHRLGRVAFHGPMVAADMARGLDDAEAASFLDALAGRYPQTLPAPFWLRPAAVTAPLVGGCLSLLVATLGTAWAVPLERCLLFWEEVNEPLYRVDRMLTHLRLSGSLAGLSGMLTGHVRWSDEDEPAKAWQQLVQSNLLDFCWPVAAGVPSGHDAPNLTLPLGLLARLDPNDGSGGSIVLGEV